MKFNKPSFVAVFVLFAALLVFSQATLTRAGHRRCTPHPCGGSDRKTAMHKCLSCTLSRLPIPEANTNLRMPGRLSGLHSLQVCRCEGLTVLPAISAPAARSGFLSEMVARP